MRENRPSGSEGGAGSNPCSYPYRSGWRIENEQRPRCAKRVKALLFGHRPAATPGLDPNQTRSRPDADRVCIGFGSGLHRVCIRGFGNRSPSLSQIMNLARIPLPPFHCQGAKNAASIQKQGFASHIPFTPKRLFLRHRTQNRSQAAQNTTPRRLTVPFLLSYELERRTPFRRLALPTIASRPNSTATNSIGQLLALISQKVS